MSSLIDKPRLAHKVGAALVPDQVQTPAGICLKGNLVGPQEAAFTLPYVLVCPSQPSFVALAMRAPPETTQGSSS
jgi:hypothetical protein